jgi:hypothetical protein
VLFRARTIDKTNAGAALAVGMSNFLVKPRIDLPAVTLLKDTPS